MDSKFTEMKKIIYSLSLSFLLLTSCASARLMTDTGLGKKYRLSTEGVKEEVSHSGVARIQRYDFYHPDIPRAFDGFRIAFASDFHLKSKYKEKALESTVRLLNSINADFFLMGGDYQEGCEYVSLLFERLAEVKTQFGTAGVMGNNDYERCYDDIVKTMKTYGMRVLEHACDTLSIGDERIVIAGVRNPFDLQSNGVSPTLNLKPEDFVILLTHTPDYAEDTDITNTDLVLAGHTHGGQVTFFGAYAPTVPSHYGQRFLKGMRKNTAGTPMIITNGLGTSNKNIRLFAPSEIVLIVLHLGLPTSVTR